MTIRGAGALKIALGGTGFGLMLVFLAWLRRQGREPTGFGMIPLAVPGAWALTGLLELVTGVPFGQIATKWDALAGWQRGVLGLLVVMVAFAVLLCAMVAFG